MRNYLIILSIILLFTAFTVSDGTYRSLRNNNFSCGEKYTYGASYGFISVAEGIVKLDPQIHTLNSRPCYKVDISGKTVGLCAIAKVRDYWTSYIDTAAIVPHRFYRNITENSYKLEETTTFDHANKTAKVAYKKMDGRTGENTFDVQQYSQDLVSGYYYIRTLDFSTLKPGDTFSFPAFYEDNTYSFTVKYIGKEVIKTKFGKLNSYVMSPIMPSNQTVFEGKDAIRFWISDDANRVPLKVRAKLFIGSFELELEKCEGMKTPFVKVQK
jgi:Protein of unknown function (DUF3108)